MPVSETLTRIGSATAIVGGLGTVVAAQTEAPGSTNASVAGMLFALGGLITALGAQVQPWIKVWSDNEREKRRIQSEQVRLQSEHEERRFQAEQDERQAKWDRHDLANQLQNAVLQIKLLEQVVDAHERTIAAHDAGIAKNLKVTNAVLDSGILASILPNPPSETEPSPPPKPAGPPPPS